MQASFFKRKCNFSLTNEDTVRIIDKVWKRHIIFDRSDRMRQCELETIMLIDLRNLLSGAKDDMTVSAPLEMETFQTALAEYPVMEKRPVELVLTKTGKDKLHISGNGFVALEIPCDRCLEPVRTEMYFDIDKDIDMQEASGEIEDEEEKDYIDGYNLDVDKLVFGEILLLIPGKTLCKEDCKGLCLRCGANLNEGECGCDRESLDPRMSVFKDILNNFKEV